MIRTMKDKRKVIAFVVVFALVGVVALVISRAATPSVSLEAESGTPAGCATKVNDSTASGGASIKFGSSTGCECPAFGPKRYFDETQRVPLPLIENSGLVQSTTDTGVFFGHNDSDGKAEVYAITGDNRIIGTYTLTGASNIDWSKANIDWEDISLGTVNGQSYIYAIDAGDNNVSRSSVQLYRFPEPTVRANQTAVTVTVNTEKIDVKHMKNGSQVKIDVEGAMIDPITGDFFFVNKRFLVSSITNFDVIDHRSEVYRIAAADLVPTSSGQYKNSQYAGIVSFPVPNRASFDSGNYPVGATAADISRDGSVIVIKGYHDTMVYKRASGQSVMDVIGGPLTSCFTSTNTIGGEAITITSDNMMLVGLAEGEDPRARVRYQTLTW